MLLTLAIISVAFVDPVALSCPDGWLQHGKSCYFLNISHSDWDTSMGYCRNHGGYLAEIEDSGENDFLTKECIRRGYGYDFWIGGRDDTEGTWIWMNSGHHFSFNNWNHGQPDNAKYDIYTEHCLELRGAFHYYWNDWICHFEMSFICEKSAISSGPSSPFG